MVGASWPQLPASAPVPCVPLGFPASSPLPPPLAPYSSPNQSGSQGQGKSQGGGLWCLLLPGQSRGPGSSQSLSPSTQCQAGRGLFRAGCQGQEFPHRPRRVQSGEETEPTHRKAVCPLSGLSVPQFVTGAVGGLVWAMPIHVSGTISLPSARRRPSGGRACWEDRLWRRPRSPGRSLGRSGREFLGHQSRKGICGFWVAISFGP